MLLAESANVSAVPEREQRDEDHGDADGPADDRRDEHAEHDRPDQVRRRRPSAAGRSGPRRRPRSRRTAATGRYSLRSASETRNGSLRLRCDEQRPGGDRDAVADVVDDRRRKQPAEARPEPRRSDGVDDPGEAGGAPAAGYQRSGAFDAPAGTKCRARGRDHAGA